MKYLREVKSEIKKVKWLSKKEIGKQFLLVNVMSLFLIIYFVLIDFIIEQVKNLF